MCRNCNSQVGDGTNKLVKRFEKLLLNRQSSMFTRIMGDVENRMNDLDVVKPIAEVVSFRESSQETLTPGLKTKLTYKKKKMKESQTDNELAAKNRADKIKISKIMHGTREGVVQLTDKVKD